MKIEVGCEGGEFERVREGEDCLGGEEGGEDGD